MDISAIGSGLGLARQTLESYINAVEALYLIERVHPWTKTDYDRASKQDKFFMTDSGLMASILRWQPEQVKFDGEEEKIYRNNSLCRRKYFIFWQGFVGFADWLNVGLRRVRGFRHAELSLSLSCRRIEA